MGEVKSLSDNLKAPVLLESKVLMERFGKVVIERIYRNPDGGVDKFFLFGSKARPVFIFALTKENEVIAVRQFRYAANEFILEIPGGCIKSVKFDVTQNGGEDKVSWDKIKETLAEELLEETGYVSAKMVSLGEPGWTDPASFDVRFYPVLALDCEKTAESKPERLEILEVVKIPFSDWVLMDHKDAKTEAMTLKALQYFFKQGMNPGGFF